jgi:putative transposase
MRKSFRYRLYPSKSQVTRLEQTLGLCCELYNAALQERRDAYRLEHKSIRYTDQQNQLPEIKAIREDMAAIHSQVLQDVLRRLDKAFQNFFRRVKERGEKAGFPRFKSRFRYDSFTYAQSGFSLNGKLRLSKIGEVRIKLHRPIEGKIKTLTITRSTTGKWFACFSVEVEPEIATPNCEAVGIDVGLTHFATLSTGEQIANPRFFREEQDALAKAQCKLSAEKKGTPERRARRRIVARIHERIKFRRNNFAHQESRKLVNRFGMIFLEDLNIRGMVKNHCLAKSIADAAWHQLFQLTNYKVENTGGLCEQVDATTDRDWNASINILLRGLAQVGLRAQETPCL